MPTLLLQPLVENAIRHGLAAGPTPGRIDVRARTADGRLRIEVRDNGIGMGRNGAARRHGIGLENTRARLAQLYGAGGMLRVEEAEGGGGRSWSCRSAPPPSWWPMADRPIRVAIVDDEPMARRSIRILLDADAEVVVAGECADGAEAARLLRATPVDLLFLDVQMPGMSGFDVLRALGTETLPAIVFVTAHDRYAIQAFDAAALDYLLKPFDNGRFAAALLRAKRRVRQADECSVLRNITQLLAGLDPAMLEGEPWRSEDQGGYVERLMARDDGRVLVLRTEQIDWLEAADYYVRAHVGPKAHLVRESLTSLESRLDPGAFVRIHRSTMVNVDRVRELQPWFQGA